MRTVHYPSRRIVSRTGVAVLVGLLAFSTRSGAAEALSAETASRLTSAQQNEYAEWRGWRTAFEATLEQYWNSINIKRDGRKRKHAARIAYTADDYVTTQPPKYAGPTLNPEIAKIVTEAEPPIPDKPLPVVTEYLEQAKVVYAFVPQRVSEKEFKLRYAAEALSLGLTSDQVVRVYALETGGDGTYDMQSGISPISRQGRAISSAIGYAQLLHGNSIDQTVKHGEGFAKRLATMATAPGVSAARAQALRNKSAIVRRMVKAAKSVPDEWSQHQKFGGTPQGMGIHTLNLDADVGPWLQALKLRGLVDTAAKEDGRSGLSGAELELMNLAGPRTGLEMMQPVGRTMPTANFFSQGGYYRNTIVREKIGSQLLAALDQRMQAGLKKAGAIEFARAFDEAARVRGGLTPIPVAATPGAQR